MVPSDSPHAASGPKRERGQKRGGAQRAGAAQAKSYLGETKRIPKLYVLKTNKTYNYKNKKNNKHVLKKSYLGETQRPSHLAANFQRSTARQSAAQRSATHCPEQRSMLHTTSPKLWQLTCFCFNK